METKKCSKCKIDKEVSSFHKRSGGYLRSRCIDCTKEDREKYLSENSDKIKEYNKEKYQNNKDYYKKYNAKYREDNKDILKEKYKKWSSKNRDKINTNNRKYRNEKIRDSFFKLKENIRSLIKSHIYKMGYTKRGKAYEILGCSYQDFKLYIEEQFVEGMSWDNHGEWHLDHKIPISWAETEEDVYKLNHYTNFQPLWAFDNLSKGNKWCHL